MSSGKKHDRIYKLYFALYICIKNLFTSYDVVISFFCDGVSFLPFFRKLHIIRSRIYCTIHHFGPPSMINRGYDKVFYLSEIIRKRYADAYGFNNGITLEWGPNIVFYDNICGTESRMSNDITFVTTGKSNRDYDLVLKVFHKIFKKVLIFSNTINENKPYVEITPQRGYVDMVKRMRYCKVNFVPCKLKEIGVLLGGLTSVIDGLALGMPLLMSDYKNISIDIEKEGFGLYYKEGDEDNLTKKIKWLCEHPEDLKIMGRKARIYAEHHQYNDFCEKMYQVIKK